MNKITDKFNRPMRDLRISVTDRCNFRCTYCMPKEVYGEAYRFLPKEELLNFDEIERITKLFANLGVSKLRITGGEPLVRKNIENLISRLSKIKGIKDIAMTTNGYLLKEKVNWALVQHIVKVLGGQLIKIMIELYKLMQTFLITPKIYQRC